MFFIQKKELYSKANAVAIKLVTNSSPGNKQLIAFYHQSEILKLHYKFSST